ncbi:hypothetical protein JZU56_05195, partial [bacterium]|nr:hypothetical protein [bacterium]
MLRLFAFLFSLLAFSAAQAVSDNFTVSGTWTAPAGVGLVTVEVWGGGGAGGGQNQNTDGGGGGGGGAYSTATVAVTPGSSYPIVVGKGGLGVASGNGLPGGDSYFWTESTVMAKGGLGGLRSTGTAPAGVAGGNASAGVGTVKFSGGNGGKGPDSNTGSGGPGGSSAGSAA